MVGSPPPASEDTAAPVDPRLVAALAVQLDAWRAGLRAGAVRVGWKLGVGDAERIGGELAVGHLTSATVLAPGATYSADDTGDLRADVEVAFEIGPDPAGPASAAPIIGGVGVALELVDLSGPPAGPEAVVAANIFHRAVAFGPFRPPPLPAGVKGRLLVNGHEAGSAPVAADVADRLAAAARVLAAAGERLKPGDRVITGSVAQVPVRPGDRVAADLGPLGRVELSIVP
jgi:2-keto-4-pentenoate hydratase